MKILLILTLIGTFVAALYLGQGKLIYHPRPYNSGDTDKKNIIRLTYVTSQGAQTVFYAPPRTNPASPPAELWLMFGGNASLALDWYDFINRYPDPGAGFLLIDYPGYGHSQGVPTPETILESTRKAISSLAAHLQVDDHYFPGKLNAVGHSLGAGVALLFASRRPTGSLILIAPFTSLKDMARLVVGKPLDAFLKHNLDNRARLDEIMSQNHPPEVTIVHGANDNVIPVSMARELAARHPAIQYHEISNTGHNMILTAAMPTIYEAMLQSP